MVEGFTNKNKNFVPLIHMSPQLSSKVLLRASEKRELSPEKKNHLNRFAELTKKGIYGTGKAYGVASGLRDSHIRKKQERLQGLNEYVSAISENGEF